MSINEMQNENTTSVTLRHPKRTFYACSFGFAAYVGSTVGLATLQSSINIKNDLGPKSLLICFLCGLAGIITAPYTLKRFGAKATLITGEIIASFLTIANFYPRWFTMYPTAALTGLMSSSLTWSASAVIVHKVATADLENKIGKQADIATQKYFGIYLGIVAFGQIFCNGVTVLILEFVNDDLLGLNHKTVETDFDSNLSTQAPQYKTSNSSVIDTSQCAAKDCPAEYAYSNSIKLDVFIPDDCSRYVLFGWYLLMQLGAVLLHSIAMDPIPVDTYRKNMIASQNEEESPNRKLLLNKLREENDCSNLFAPIKISVLHLTSLQGILSAPVYLLYGLTISFIWSEFSRAYASCVVGLSQVGLTSALVDFLSLIVSMIISRCASNFGMFYIFLFGMCYDIALYVAILFWVPTPSTSYFVYIFASLFGVTYAVRRNTQYLTTSALCPDKDVGFTIQNVLGGIGLMMTYAWTTAFCVYVKIYIMIGSVVARTVFWIFADRIHQKERN
uniref:protein unc-93 homolog A-like n=1 Tax=Styela clava TaxID=7725 RepID=UPI001939C73B|nr:protein unc-93 homolog A-like [Styela clava]